MGKATFNSSGNNGVDFGLINQPGIGKNCQNYDGCTWEAKGDRCRACIRSKQRDYDTVILHKSGGLTIKELRPKVAKGIGDE